jgi:lysosomal acid lipase/cholesteryl ester hydrolase
MNYLLACLLGSALIGNYLIDGAAIIPNLKKGNNVQQLLTSVKSQTHDPEEKMTPIELITSKGYPAEGHIVVTDDGYVLNMQRIPYGKHAHGVNDPPNRPVIFLQHGLLCSSTNWLTNLENESFAFILADAGFDVWMGNFRGNTYSKGHAWLSTSSHEYWQFSWDEMAKYDLPAMINYVLAKTGKDQIYYSGHSQGTMTMFAKLSEDPVFASKIKEFYAQGPVSTVGYIEGPLRLIAGFTNELDWFLNLVGIDEFLPNSYMTDLLAHYVCGWSWTNPLCGDILFVIAGPDSVQLNNTRIPVYIAHTPAGTSTQNIVHFGQQVNSKKYAKYDFGKKGNLQKYGSESPPEYDLTKVNVPTYLFWGVNDWLADPTDVGLLVEKLNPAILKGNTGLADFNHMDFIWGMNAPAEVYSKIIALMNAREREDAAKANKAT